MRKLFILLLLSICASLPVYADTFVVTSAADSGAGTLREAILKANANGTDAVDFIHFNIPAKVYNERLIRLVTELPALTSNIVIDATTQPGEAYGTTDAKICLIKTDLAPRFSMLTIEDAQNVAIYGMHLYYGYWEGLFSPAGRPDKLYGITLIHSTEIEIGAPGKGNVIHGVVHGIYSNSQDCSDISIRSNYLGHGRFYQSNDDIDAVVLVSECGITLSGVKNITIGGATPEEGNVFGSQNRGVNIDSRYATGNGFIRIRYNLFGFKFNREPLADNIYDFWDSYVSVGRSRNNPSSWSSDHRVDYEIDFLDNISYGQTRFSEIGGFLNILRNRFLHDPRIGGGTDFKLAVWRCDAGGMVGTENAADANIFLDRKLYADTYPSLFVSNSAITVGKNVFECNSVYGSTILMDNDLNTPFVQVDFTSSSMVTGRAQPHTRVDLYYDDDCTACEGKSFIATVLASDAGIWKYEGSITKTVVAIATNAYGYSSGFSEPTYNNDQVKIVHPSCGEKNGSITGITTEGAETFFWLRYPEKDTVSHSLDLVNVGPGYYVLFGVHGGTCIRLLSGETLEDATPGIYADNTTLLHPSCGQNNGSIVGINLHRGGVMSGFHSVHKWIDAGGETVGLQMNIHHLAQGTYSFVVWDTISGCSDTATFTLVNISGPELSTDAVKITPASCSASNGSISGITFSNTTGEVFLEWTDSTGKIVGNSLVLENVTAGRYRLRLKDRTACDTIVTAYFVVESKGDITIDTDGMTVLPGRCDAPSGRITGIVVSGGESFEWRRISSGDIAGNSPEVSHLSAGAYQLRVANRFGCTTLLPVINVPVPTFNDIGVTTISTRDAACGEDNGGLQITNFTKDQQGYSFRWTAAATGEIVSNTKDAIGLKGGSYQLVATDENVCEKAIYTAQIKAFPAPSFNYSAVVVQDDQCSRQVGGVSNLVIRDLRGPTTFTWYDDQGKITGTGRDLARAKRGDYTLEIKDATCIVRSGSFEVKDQSVPLTPPVFDDLTIPRYTTAEFIVRNPTPGGDYQLYADPAQTLLVQHNATGHFTIPAVATDTSFYVRFRSGICQSPLVGIKVKVVDDSYFAMPNAFTPNGDGLNDRMPVLIIGYMELDFLRIYNQWGQLVFETRDTRSSWDGRFRGEPQNAGTYVWVAQGRDIRGNKITGKGHFMLIR